MSTAERILLVEEIWDSIAATPDSVPLSDAQRTELDARLEARSKRPREGSSWRAVKARIRRRICNERQCFTESRDP